MARLRNPGEPIEGEDPLAEFMGPFPGQPGYEGNPGINPEAAKPAQSNDRAAFNNDWMSTSGTMDEFMKSHPQYGDYVKPKAGSKDQYSLGNTGETLDLLGDEGGQNKHNWTPTGADAVGAAPQGGGFGPNGNLPPAFGSLNDFMSSQGAGNGDIMGALKGLFPGGAYNQGIVNQRTDSARDDIQRQMKSRNASNKAALANRGLIGDGPEITAQNRAEEDLFKQFTNSVGDIRSNESENADQRMMMALQLATGMSEEEAKLALQSFLGQGELALGNRKAGIDETLGLGNLALGNTKANNDYNLGLGSLDLGWGQLDSEDWNNLQNLLLKGADISSGGRIGK